MPDPGDPTGDLDARLAAATERLGHAARLLLRAAAARHGVSIIQAQLLLRLASDVAGASRSISAMTQWFDVRQPTISDAVSTLQRKGLVTKTRQGRNQHVELTPAGGAAAADLTRWDQPLRAALHTHSLETRGQALELLLDAIGALSIAGVVTIARTCTTCRFFQQATAPTGEHRCGLLGVPLPRAGLRLDCPEHEPRRAVATHS